MLGNRAQMPMSADMAVKLVVGLMIFGVLAAVMLPVAINSIEADTSVTLNQTVDTTYDVNAELTSNVTNSDTTNNDLTIELNDTRTSTTVSKTIGVGTNATYSLEGGDVVVTADEAGTNYGVATYEYSKDYPYSGGASSMWGLLGLAIVLAALLYAVAIAMRYV